jgi:hypothetical protein
MPPAVGRFLKPSLQIGLISLRSIITFWELTQSPATASGSWALILKYYSDWIDLASLDHRIRGSLPKALQLPQVVGRFLYLVYRLD